MIETIGCLFTSALAGWLCWNLGVRRERGRQLRLVEIERAAAPPRRKGIKLHSLKIRR